MDEPLVVGAREARGPLFHDKEKLATAAGSFSNMERHESCSPIMGLPLYPMLSHPCVKQYNIRKIMSTLYTPQSNGVVERFMGYLKTALITLISNRPKKWDLFLAVILFA